LTAKLAILPDFGLEIGNLHFILEDLDRAAPRLSIYGSATLKYKEKSLNIVCSASHSDITEDRRLRSALSAGDSLQTLADMLPYGLSDWKSATVPFTGAAPSNLCNVGLDSIGLVVAQPNPDIEAYNLVSIFAATKIETWKDYLPFDFPKAIKATSVRLEVLNPLDFKALRIGVIVDFTVEISANANNPAATTLLGVTLSALPLVQPKDYHYGLFIHDFGEGVSLARICTIVGLGNVVDSIHTSIPFLGDVSKSVRIKAISLSL
jgi:hypothetical protein